MEKLTSAPSITNIYGHCATSVLVEKGLEIYRDITPRYSYDDYHEYIPQKELDELQMNDVYPMINYILDEKLDLAILMGQSLAELNGYIDGAITMDDVVTYQWLVSDADKKRITLKDFGNSVFLS